MKPGKNDRKHQVLITGAELRELQQLDMPESLGLNRRIERYQGKRPIGVYRWDLECLLATLSLVVERCDLCVTERRRDAEDVAGSAPSRIRRGVWCDGSVSAATRGTVTRAPPSRRGCEISQRRRVEAVENDDRRWSRRRIRACRRRRRHDIEYRVGLTATEQGDHDVRACV